MAASITHRATGIALSAGTLLIAWWLIATSSGPESGSFQLFTSVLATPLGKLVLFGFVWSLTYHFLNGIRHLAWDVGYGFDVKQSSAISFSIYTLSIALAAAGFALYFTGHTGYLAQ